MQLKVSVIMPAHNVAAYIGESILSVKAQTFSDWELIIVDDGSVDGTREVTRQYTAADSRVSYYYQENQGVSVARNKGLAMATGELVAFLDADDLWHPDFLSELVKEQSNSAVDLVFSQFVRLLPNGSFETNDYDYSQVGRKSLLFLTLTHTVWLHIGGILVRRNFLSEHEIGFHKGCTLSEDEEFEHKVFTKASFSHIPKELAVYRHRPGSACRREWSWEHAIHAIEALERAKCYVGKHYTGRDKNEVEEEYDKLIAMKKFRFLYTAVQHGYYDRVVKAIDQEYWRLSLETVKRSSRRPRYGVETRLLLSKSRTLWQAWGWCKAAIRRIK